MMEPISKLLRVRHTVARPGREPGYARQILTNRKPVSCIHETDGSSTLRPDVGLPCPAAAFTRDGEYGGIAVSWMPVGAPDIENRDLAGTAHDTDVFVAAFERGTLQYENSFLTVCFSRWPHGCSQAFAHPGPAERPAVEFAVAA